MNFLRDLDKEIKSLNEKDIKNILKSIESIEKLKKYITYIKKYISNLKIKKLNIFDSLTMEYFRCIGSNNLNDFIYLYSKKFLNIISTKCKSFYYNEKTFNTGYIYFEQETINVYSDNYSYIIKYLSIINISLDNFKINLFLKNEKFFKIELSFNDETFFNKLQEKCKKIQMNTDIEYTENPSSSVFHYNTNKKADYCNNSIKLENEKQNIFLNNECLKNIYENSPVSLKKKVYKNLSLFDTIEDNKENNSKFKTSCSDEVKQMNGIQFNNCDTIIQNDENICIFGNNLIVNKDENLLAINKNEILKNKKSSIVKHNIYLSNNINFIQMAEYISSLTFIPEAFLYHENKACKVSFKKIVNLTNLNFKKDKIFKYIRKVYFKYLKYNSCLSNLNKKIKKNRKLIYKKILRNINFFFIKYKFIIKKLEN